MPRFRRSLALAFLLVPACSGTVSGPARFGPAPVLERLDPPLGPPGTLVRIRGRGFGSDPAAVRIAFNGLRGVADPSHWSDTAVEVTVPAGATSGPVVAERQGAVSNGLPFTVTVTSRLLGPFILSLDPSRGDVGDSVTIGGGNFGDAPGQVSFNGVTAAIASWSNATIVARVPEGGSTGEVVVTVAGTASNGVVFYVGAASVASPLLTRVVPASASVGDEIVVEGSGFGPYAGGGEVDLAGASAPEVRFWSPVEVHVVVPPGASSGPLLLRRGGLSSNAIAVNVVPASGPVLRSATPPWAEPGGLVFLDGGGFGSLQGQVELAGAAIPVGSWTPARIQVLIPPGAHSGEIRVFTSPATSSNALWLAVGESLRASVLLTRPAFMAEDPSEIVYVSNANQVTKLTSNGVYIGPIVSPPGGLRLPYGVAVSGGTDLFVADNQADTLVRYSITPSEVQYLETFGTVSTLQAPTGLAVDPARRRLYVGVGSGGAAPGVGALDLVTGGFSSVATGLPLQSLYGVTLSPTGYLYLADPTGNRVGIVNPGISDPATSFVGFLPLPAGLVGPFGIAFSGGGTAYVSFSGTDNLLVVPPGGAGLVYGNAQVFVGPAGLFVLPDGRVLVADRGASALTVMDAQGTFLGFWGPPPLSGPSGLLEAPDGSFLVARPGAGIVERVTSGLEYVSSLGPVGNPRGIAVDPSSGALYVADAAGGDVAVFNPFGILEGSLLLPGGEGSPFGLVVGADGALFVSDEGSGTIDRAAPGGAPAPWLTGLGAPTGLALTPSGDLFVADGGRIWVVRSSGALFDLAAPPGARALDYLAYDPASDLLYATEDATASLYWIRGSSGASARLGLDALAPTGVTTGADGGVYVADRILGEIRRFSPVVGP